MTYRSLQASATLLKGFPNYKEHKKTDACAGSYLSFFKKLKRKIIGCSLRNR